VTLTHSRFNELRNELEVVGDAIAGLADRLYESGFSGRNGDALRKLRRDMDAQKFKVVLVAPFQGGKSTVFNTVVGGRELSPTGTGLATSSCVVEAHYLEDGDEYVEIEWRSEQDLLAGFIGVLLQHMDGEVSRDKGDQHKILWSDMTVCEAARRLSLDNPEHRYLLEGALPKVMRKAERDPKALLQKDLEYLRIGALVLKYRAWMVKKQNSSNPSLIEAISWLKFPDGWHVRDLDDFRPEEVVFLFLKRVKFHLNSPALADLGAVVVDCPGRQAGNFDEAVAEEAISNAHAVMFLLGTRGKGISRGELETARWLAQQGTAERLFVVYNAKKVSEYLVRDHFIPADIYQMNRVLRPALKLEDISVFNALLALRAKQYQAFETLPEETVHELSDRSKRIYPPRHEKNLGRNERAYARLLIEREIEDAYRDFTGEYPGTLNRARVAEIESESGWPVVLRQVTDFLAHRNGATLLLESGARPIQDELAKLNAELEALMRAPEETRARWEEEKKRAKEALAELEEEVCKAKTSLTTFLEADRPQLSSGMKTSSTIYSRLLDRKALFPSHVPYTALFSLVTPMGSKGTACEILLGELRKELDSSDLQAVLERVVRSAPSSRQLPELLHGEIQSSQSAILSGWIDDVQTGSSEAGKELRKRIEATQSRIQAALKKARIDGGALLKGLPIRLDLNWGSLPVGGRSFAFSPPSLEDGLVIDVVNELEDELRTGGWSFISDLRELWADVREEFTDERFDYDHYIDQLPAVVATARDEADEHARNLVGQLLASVRTAVKAAFEIQSRALRGDVESRITRANSIIAETLKNQRAKAKMAGQLRKEHVAPIQRALTAVVAQVESAGERRASEKEST
jgi:hypothetical protein